MESYHRKFTPGGKPALFATLLFCVFTPNFVFAQGTDSLFDFTSDVRLFTAYAMMNAGSGMGEWRHAGMDSVRLKLRSDLAGRIDSSFQDSIHEFNRSHGRVLETYEYALLTDGPPDFRLNYNPNTTGISEDTVKSDSALSDLLARFYKDANVPQLWEKYRPIIQAEDDSLRSFSATAMADIISYCNLDSNYFLKSTRRIHFQFMPLIPFFTSLAVRVNGEIYVIIGPQESKPDRSMLYYDLLHQVAGPLVGSDTVNVERLSPLYDSVKSRIDLRRGNWKTLMIDCFAEAIDIRMEQTLYGLDSSAVWRSLMNEYKRGLILCPAIYINLVSYEQSDMTFPDYYPTLIKRISLENQLRHWREYWDRP